MFSTLESSWDKSARRGWSAIASFGFQALALSLLLAIPMFWVQGPPILHWLQPLTVPIAQAPALPMQHRQTTNSTNMSGPHVLMPPSIPPRIASLHDPAPIEAPELGPGVINATGPSSRLAILNSTGTGTPMVTLKPPPPVQPPRISHWAEGNLIYRVQPVYPPLAKQARIQGVVQLRAIISKAGTVDHLTLESGHPMLAGAAIEAVRQWRYRPYRLNDEPIAIETEITVNFVLAAN